MCKNYSLGYSRAGGGSRIQMAGRTVTTQAAGGVRALNPLSQALSTQAAYPLSSPRLSCERKYTPSAGRLLRVVSLL